MGETFTVADAYLYNVTRWCPLVKVDITAHTQLQAFIARVASRESVKAALAAEGIA